MPQAGTVDNSFRKEERLCGKSNISALLSEGRWAATEHLKYCYRLSPAFPFSIESQDNSDGPDFAPDSSLERNSSVNSVRPNRILISVPKKYFKRAVKRNLLKRRLREAYRLNKSLLRAEGVDFMLTYCSKEIQSFSVLESEMKQILSKIDKYIQR